MKHVLTGCRLIPLPTPFFSLSLLPLFFSLFHTISVDGLTEKPSHIFRWQMCQSPVMMRGDIPQNSQRQEALLRGYRKQEVTKDELFKSLTYLQLLIRTLRKSSGDEVSGCVQMQKWKRKKSDWDWTEIRGKMKTRSVCGVWCVCVLTRSITGVERERGAERVYN